MSTEDKLKNETPTFDNKFELDFASGDTTLWDTGIAIRRITNYIKNRS